MSDHESPVRLQKAGATSAKGVRAASNAQRCIGLPAVLGLLAGDNQTPHDGERAIVASAIWNALQCCTVDELPSVSRLVRTSSEDLRSRAQFALDIDLSMRGSLALAPLLALCAQIHRGGFVDADGKQARSLLFLALVDLGIHCPDLIPSSPFKQTVDGLRIQLERLTADPKRAVATHDISVWQLFDWVATHEDLAEYVKRAVRTLRPRFVVAWKALDEHDASDIPTGDDAEDDAWCLETSLGQTFWSVPDQSRFSAELPEELAKTLLSAELTRVTAMSRFASASLLVRSNEEMTTTVSSLFERAQDKASEAPNALMQLLAIAGCIPLGRVRDIRWATAGAFPGTPQYPGVLTADARWLIRGEFDPRSSKVPFHPHSLHVPIPEPLAKLLREYGAGGEAGTPVLPVEGQSLPPTPREASAWETTLASRLMRDERFGVSLAQHVLHTTFGLDTSPLYYDRIPAWHAAHAIAEVTHPWFGAKPRPHADVVLTHHIGSQRVVARANVRSFLMSLRSGWVEKQELWERIHHRSRNLRYGILISVAHRTNDRITEVTTQSIARGEMLATIADKAIAIDCPHRIAALGTKVVNELEHYLNELEEATRAYPGTSLARAASRILSGEQGLFIGVRSPTDCYAVTRDVHIADGPPWAGDIVNWARHFTNDELGARLGEPLRVSQLGWIGTRSGATSELSPASVVDALSRVRVAVDALLKENGWAPLPTSGRLSVRLPAAPVHWMQARRDHERSFRLGLEGLKQAAATSRRSLAERAVPALNAFFRANAVALEATIDGFQKADGARPIPLNRDHHAALLRLMCVGTSEQMTARELLYQWLEQARRGKVIAGPLPRKPVRSWPMQSSPFLVSAHHSIRHRDDLLAAAHASSLSPAARTFLTVMAQGWVADADIVLQLMHPGASLYELPDQDVLLLEPVRAIATPTSHPGALAFKGAAALALRVWHRNRDAHTPDRLDLQTEIHAAIRSLLHGAVTPDEVFGELEVLMRTYWGLRAPGIVRDVVIRRVIPAFAPLERLVALHEHQPAWPAEIPKPALDAIKAGIRKARRHATAAGYERVKAILSELAEEWTPANDGRVRAEAITSLRLLVPEDGARTGAHLIALYAAAYLEEGIRKAHVRPVTVQDAVYSIGSVLIEALPEQGDFSNPELWQAAYARLLHSCPSKDRHRLARDVTHFQKVMAREHDLPVVSLSRLLNVLDVPAPPEPIGFLTCSEQQGLISRATYRHDALAQQGRPSDQIDALRALAASACALSTNIRDRELRVPLVNDWRVSGDGTALIALRSNGLDFVKTQAGRRAVRLTGAHANVARDAIDRLLRLNAIRAASPQAQKLFSPAAMETNGRELCEITAMVNADLRYVTANRLAAIDLTRKTWALAAFRSLDGSQLGTWRTRDLLAEIGHAGISTMQGHYLHDPLAFLERIPTERAPPRSVAGWLLGMHPKSARRLLEKRNSWLHQAQDHLPHLEGSHACELHALSPSVPYEPTLAETEVLLRLYAEGTSTAAAVDCLKWPRGISAAVEAALAVLRERGVGIGSHAGEGEFALCPPLREAADASLEACIVDASGWAPMVWVFDHWLPDWRARHKKGVYASSHDWERIVGTHSPVSRLPWTHEPKGHMTFHHLPAKPGRSHSLWPQFRWLALAAWFRQEVMNYPPAGQRFEAPARDASFTAQPTIERKQLPCT